jgi:hypothetical protein
VFLFRGTYCLRVRRNVLPSCSEERTAFVFGGTYCLHAQRNVLSVVSASLTLKLLGLVTAQAISRLRHGFNSKSGHAERVAMGAGFLRILQFPLPTAHSSSIISRGQTVAHVSNGLGPTAPKWPLSREGGPDDMTSHSQWLRL